MKEKMGQLVRQRHSPFACIRNTDMVARILCMANKPGLIKQLNAFQWGGGQNYATSASEVDGTLLTDKTVLKSGLASGENFLLKQFSIAFPLPRHFSMW